MMKKMMVAGLMAATMLAAGPASAQRADRGDRQDHGRGDGGGYSRGQDRSQDRGPAQGGSQDRNGWQGRQPAAQQSGQSQAQQQQQQAGQQAMMRQQQVQQAQRADRSGWQGNRDRNGDGRPDGNRWDSNRDGRPDNGRDRQDAYRGTGYRNDAYRNNAYRNDAYRNDAYRNDSRARLDARTRWSNQRQWNSNWRNDRRYDWRSYRSHYGNVFRAGRYYAPRGWSYGYRPFSIGIYLDSLLYSDAYWLDDPWAYRLPPAYGTLRWVRYYDDALLVDIRDGYVVDVIRDFFY